MTKPADERTAKAREQRKQLEKEALELHGKHGWRFLVTPNACDFAAAFAEVKIKEAREECATLADEITIYTDDDCFSVRSRIVSAIRGER